MPIPVAHWDTQILVRVPRQGTEAFRGNSRVTVIRSGLTLKAGEVAQCADAGQKKVGTTFYIHEALEESNAQIGAVIESSQLSNIPVNGRNWATLMTLAPLPAAKPFSATTTSSRHADI